MTLQNRLAAMPVRKRITVERATSSAMPPSVVASIERAHSSLRSPRVQFDTSCVPTTSYQLTFRDNRCSRASKRPAIAGSMCLSAVQASPARRQAASTSPPSANAVRLVRRISEIRFLAAETSVVFAPFEACSLGVIAWTHRLCRSMLLPWGSSFPASSEDHK